MRQFDLLGSGLGFSVFVWNFLKAKDSQILALLLNMTVSFDLLSYFDPHQGPTYSVFPIAIDSCHSISV